MVREYSFKEEDLSINDNLGFPKAYAKLCRDRNFDPYSHGPPFTFAPYSLHQNEAMREMELDQMFPIIDKKAKPTTQPKKFVNILWKQLSHLGNAGFDPTMIRVDPFGNVVYFHADPGSPLAWDIDHWFPCSRGGLTVPSNLRILQWQVHKRKHNKLELLIPWWDLQLGISINQFLSIFASSNFDFRHRAFSFLFYDAETEEINTSQTVDSHNFPQHFIKMAKQVGLAPAAIVTSQKQTYDIPLALKSLDHNRQIGSRTPSMATRDVNPILKENENLDLVMNPHQAIVMARNSLKEREDTSKIRGEIQKLDDELNELKQKNEEEKLTIQDLELVLAKRRIRVAKCWRLAEAQSSYRTVLEKMIRDAMHQTVIYKEQVRLSQSASNALMARLEAQRAICDASEKELHTRFKQRDEIEKQIRPEWDQTRKRIRMDDIVSEDVDNRSVFPLPGMEPNTALEKAQKTSKDGVNLEGEKKQEENIKEEPQKPVTDDMERKDSREHNKSIVAFEEENSLEHKAKEEDEESRKKRGKGNIDKWLEMLLENTQEELKCQNVDDEEPARLYQLVRKLNVKIQRDIKTSNFPEAEEKEGISQKTCGTGKLQILQENDGGKRKEKITETGREIVTEKSNAKEVFSNVGGVGSGHKLEGEERMDKSRKERGLVRSESARIFRRISSSPSRIFGMRKGLDLIGKKPRVNERP